MKPPITWGFLTAAVALAAPALAEEPKPAMAPEAQRLVKSLAGKWTAAMSLTMPGQAAIKFKGVWECKPIAAGSAVDCRLSVKVPGLGLMDETDVWAWDPETKSLYAYTVNNIGEVHAHKAAWKDEKTIAFAQAATLGGKPIDERFTMTFDAPKKMSFKFEVKAAEGTTVFEGAATRP